MNEQKTKIVEYINSIHDELAQLARDIHDNPELGCEEYKAVEFISKVLENHGFTVQKGYAGVPTAFRADAPGKGDGPCVAFLAEYDAMAGLGVDKKSPGHACGHNLIATCSTAAFLALAQQMSDFDGRICLIGTPAEETLGCKIAILNNGGFDDVQYALMMHPSSGGSNLVGRGGRASGSFVVDFKGKSVHSSNPKMGINALNAVISVFNQIDMLRPTFDPQDNINGIIPVGGTVTNAIPEDARGAFSLRAETMQRIEELLEIMKRCVANAENLTGAKATVKIGKITAERYPNRPLNQAFKDNMAELGIEMVWPNPKMLYGSSDIGNVSIRMPIIHDYLSITDENVPSHSSDYTAITDTPEAIDIALKGGMGLAMTAIDVLSSKEFQEEALQYHAQQVPEFYKNK